MQIAFFDFDGTITTKDSFIDFIRYVVGYPRLLAGLTILSPMLILYLLRIVANARAKEIVLKWFFAGMPEDRFRRLAAEYAREEIDRMVRPEALARIKWHQQEGHKIVVVTASADCWVEAWSQRLGLDLIATRLEFEEQKCTGRLLSPNCFGPEKVIRIKKLYNVSDYSRIYAYGDSSGDREMLELAHEKYFRWEKIP